MTKHYKARLTDLLGAMHLLTRLPLPALSAKPDPAAAWCWPLVGALLGAVSAGLAAAMGLLAPAIGSGALAGLLLATQVMLTGALHEDGLADTADGFWGGWDKARRMEIMKDSHIGTYGVMALIVVTLLRWTGLVALIGMGQWWALVVVGAMSRAPMALLLAVLPNARGAGLAHSVGAVPRAAAGVAMLMGLGFALTLGAAGLAAVVAVVSVVFVLAALARAKIGGQTGDILGASQQLAEAAALTALAATLG